MLGKSLRPLGLGLGACILMAGGWPGAAYADIAARSTNIDLLSDGQKLVAVNRESNSLSLFRVRVGTRDRFVKIGEVGVGHDPRYLCLRPGDEEVWVTNSASGTITRINLRGRLRVTGEFYLGSEPRGCAFTPNGKLLLVALRTEGRVAVLEADSGSEVLEAAVGGQPEAIAITNDGDLDDLDEWAFVTQFFAEPIPGGPGEGFDDGRQGAVHAFPVVTCMPEKISLAPALSGFTADRTAFCPQFNSAGHSDIYCPDPAETNPLSETITRDPQAAFPNQLHSVILRQGRAYVVSTAAQPEPPVRFNVNVQAFVSVIDVETRREDPARLTRFNNQIKTEQQPDEAAGSTDRLFANDVVALDASPDGRQFLFVSRGGNYLLRASNNAAGGLDIGAPDQVVRVVTGNIPTGVVANPDWTRAYVNNEVSGTLTVVDLSRNEVVAELTSSTPPAPGTPEHRARVGKLAFFTALGTGSMDLLGTPIQDIDPLLHRNEASDNGWSSCASCHPNGLSDSVTWIFATGPRQAIPMDGSWGNTPDDQRVFNWNGVRSSVRDFNNNARNVQGGEGFVDNPGSIFNHGLTHGLSDGLDLMTFWLQSKVRTPNQPAPGPDQLEQVAAGREVFAQQCAGCHGGGKFTKSSLVFRNNPTFEANPLAGGQVLDPGLTNAGPQLISFDLAGSALGLLDDVGTFDAEDPREIRGAGAAGQTALGGLGFNTPSLKGVGSTAPFFHNGSAANLEEVFFQHRLPVAGGETISTVLTTEERASLLRFLQQLDGRTQPVDSAAERFRESLLAP